MMPRVSIWRVCSVEDCERRAVCRGWCSMHYQRWHRHGDPLVVLPTGVHVTAHGTPGEYSNHGCRCSVCKEAHRTYMGEMHVRRGERLGPCTLEGCDVQQYSRGYCKAHYERQRTGRTLDKPVVQRPNARRWW